MSSNDCFVNALAKIIFRLLIKTVNELIETHFETNCSGSERHTTLTIVFRDKYQEDSL